MSEINLNTLRFQGLNGIYKIPDPADFAPSGYGLGFADSTPYCADANTAMKNGWYRIDAATTNGIGSGCIMRVDAWADTWSVTQTAYTTNESSLYYTIRQRWYWRDKGWQEWEYVNPPMVLGVEYRTTERWNGKSVYTMLVHCGAGTVAGSYKTVSTTIAGTANTIRYHVDVTNSAGNKLGNPPLEYTDGSVMGRITVSATNNITIMCYKDLSETDIYCQLWYTKD